MYYKIKCKYTSENKYNSALLHMLVLTYLKAMDQGWGCYGHTSGSIGKVKGHCKGRQGQRSLINFLATLKHASKCCSLPSGNEVSAMNDRLLIFASCIASILKLSMLALVIHWIFIRSLVGNSSYLRHFQL